MEWIYAVYQVTYNESSCDSHSFMGFSREPQRAIEIFEMAQKAIKENNSDFVIKYEQDNISSLENSPEQGLSPELFSRVEYLQSEGLWQDWNI